MAVTAPVRNSSPPGADPVPAFSMLLPRGWVSREPSSAVFSELSARVSGVFRRSHRPDLDARFSSIWERATTELLRRDPVRIMFPGDVAPEDLFPISIVAVRVTDPVGMSLDRRVRELVRVHDARPMDEESKILRWHVDDRLRMDGGVATVRSFNYLIALPGTHRREALMFSGVLPTGAGESLDEETIQGAQLLMDAIMSTFSWDAP